MTEITFENMSENLIEAFPELRPQYEDELAWWRDEKPGPHIIYGDLLVPYITSLLERGGDEEKLRRIFAFLEELANHEDIRVQEVVAVSICERLGDQVAWLAKARLYMGDTTLRISREMEAGWGRE